jgi:hypothetical protein
MELHHVNANSTAITDPARHDLVQALLFAGAGIVGRVRSPGEPAPVSTEQF